MRNFLLCLLAQLLITMQSLRAFSSPLLSRSSQGRQSLAMVHNTQRATPGIEAGAMQQMRMTAAKAALLVGLFCSSGLGAPAPALADLDSDFEVTSTVTAVRAVGFRDSTAAAPDASISKPAAKSVSADSITDDSYRNSLEKEQKKQNARKKTKTERSRDLCESLGRGC